MFRTRVILPFKSILIIPQDERFYILANTSSRKKSKRRRKSTAPPAPVPYSRMLRSRPFWALQAAVCGYAWVAYVMLTLTPSYLHSIQNVSYSIVRIINVLISAETLLQLEYPSQPQIGYLSALPYLVNFILVFPISYSAERVVQIQLMNVKTQRKL